MVYFFKAASNAFNALLKGRGKDFVEETATSAFLVGDKSIVLGRPIRELLPKEIHYYMKINDLGKYVFNRRNLCLDVKGKAASLPGRGNFTFVIDSFLSKLQVYFFELKI